MIRAEIKKIKNLKFIPPPWAQAARQMDKGTERERKLGKYFFLNHFFENLFY